MATYNWSALSDGQVINFNPAVDKIRIDIAGLQAPQLQDWNWYLKNGTPTFLIRAADKSVEFSGLTIENFTSTTLTFASGARFLAGDGLTGTTGDANGNLLTGGSVGDVLFGLDGNDTLRGGSGDDILNGGYGDDLLDGGAGMDWAFYSRDSASPLLANLMTGKIYQSGNVDSLISIEAVRGGMGDDTYIGNAADNLFRGLGGIDYFNGHDGFDIVRYREAIGTQGARVDLSLNRASNDGFGNADFLFNIEGVVGTYFSDSIKGDASNNLLHGDWGNDTLSGGAGNDSLDGGVGSDRLDGGSGNDLLFGGDGNDYLKGGLGADKLTGGTGADRFAFSSAKETGTSTTTRDAILDFVRGSDRIDLAAIDANAASSTANEAFTFIGSKAFGTNATAQLRYSYDATKGSGVLYGSTDADTAAEFSIQIVGATTLAATDFML